MIAFRAPLNVLRALIIRDLMARFGRHHLGFVWTMLEPMILCCGVMFVWSLIKEPLIHGIPVITFVLTGYMPLTLWRHLTNPLTRMLGKCSGLLYHQPISHVSIILSRCFLEFFSTTAALGVIYFVSLSLNFVDPIADFGLTLAAWLLTGWYFGTQGILLSVWTESWEPAEKFIQPLQYLQLPLSGVFFMVDWLPDSAEKLLLLNPSVHCFEMFRAGFLGDSVTTHYDARYLITASLLFSIAAAGSLYHVRHRLQFA